jgi:inactivated superfamily I helicase
MRKTLILTAAGLTLSLINTNANAQVDLSTYADAEGYLDVQTLSCAQLAGTWQDQADLLTTWYSGWYNGLAKKHYLNIGRSKETEHEVIVYCKANPQVKIIEAIDIVFKKWRAERGIIIAK